MGKIFCAEFQSLPSKFHIEYLTYTLRDVIFYKVENFKSYNVFLDGPRSLTVLYDTSCFYGACLMLNRKDRFDSWTKDGTASIRDHHPHQLLDVGLFRVDTTDPPTYPQLARPDLRRSVLKWRHNERDGVSNHQPHDCLFNCLFRQIKENIKAPRHWPLCCCTGNCHCVKIMCHQWRWPCTYLCFSIATNNISIDPGSLVRSTENRYTWYRRDVKMHTILLSL